MTTPVPPPVVSHDFVEKGHGFSFNASTFLKAIYAGFSAALAGTSAALIGAHTLTAITDAQWISVAGFAFASFGAVYGVSNATKS